MIVIYTKIEGKFETFICDDSGFIDWFLNDTISTYKNESWMII